MLFGRRRSVEDFERTAKQAVAIALYAAKVTAAPGLNFLKNATWLREDYLRSLSSDVGIRTMCAGDTSRHLLILAYHAFGAGAYIASEGRNCDDLDDLHSARTRRMRDELARIGSLELGLKAISVDPHSDKKRVLDSILVSTLADLQMEFKEELADGAGTSEYLMSLMGVFFNMGVTVAVQ